MRIFDWLTKAKESPSFRPAYIRIKPENTSDVKPPEPFVSNQEYFEVVVNEMYLSYKRKWLNVFDPTVFATTEFEYDGKTVSVPFVVGPSMIASKKQILPAGQGFIFKNTAVAGIHPFKGNSLTLTLILSRIPAESALRKVINVLEKLAGTYTKEFQAIASGYLKVASVVIDSIESLTESDDVKPIIGIRDEFSLDNARPGYFVLVNEESNAFDPDKFFVTGKGLCYGDRNTEFRTDDYLLFSIRKIDRRNDIETLPIFQTWKEMNKSISKIARKLSDDEKRLYRGQLMSLAAEMVFSPDLTDPQANQLAAEYSDKLEEQIRHHDLLSGNEQQEKNPEPDEWKSKIEKLNRLVQH